MASRLTPTDIVGQARSVLEGWKRVDPDLKIGDFDHATLSGNLDRVAPILAEIDGAEAHLTDLRNQRDVLLKEIWDQIKRLRSAVKGIYGDDSSQYELVGGTRLSERKTTRRR